MPTKSIFSTINCLNNPNEHGGYFLPHIQRPFVWDTSQIVQLFDSILRGYPFGSLLFFKTTEDIRHRKFIDNYLINSNHDPYFMPGNGLAKTLVLDGQQRLQALFIGLIGSYDGKELYFNVLSGGDVNNYDDNKYVFKFIKTPQNAPFAQEFPFVKFKDLVYNKQLVRMVKDQIVQGANKDLTRDEINSIEDNLDRIRDEFLIKERIIFDEIDQVTPHLGNTNFTIDDIVEVFIRANSGGTVLEKSDLIFCLLTAGWGEAESNIDILLDDLNVHGFKFKRDFILKLCLILFNKGARFDIIKFRNDELKNSIVHYWQNISNCILIVKDFLNSHTLMRTDKLLPSYASLFPMIYSIYHNYERNINIKRDDYVEYLLKVNLAGAFGGVNDSFTDSLIGSVIAQIGFNKEAIYQKIRDNGKSLEITKEKLFSFHYASKEIHLLFNLWYGFDYQYSFEGNSPQIDHIFPQSALKRERKLDPLTNTERPKYSKSEINQLANLMLLTRDENGAGGKSDTLPSVWFTGDRCLPAYLDKHCIPNDPNLWQLDRYHDFIEARKELIIAKLRAHQIISGV